MAHWHKLTLWIAVVLIAQASAAVDHAARHVATLEQGDSLGVGSASGVETRMLERASRRLADECGDPCVVAVDDMAGLQAAITQGADVVELRDTLYGDETIQIPQNATVVVDGRGHAIYQESGRHFHVDGSLALRDLMLGVRDHEPDLMLGVRDHEPGILQFLLERGGVAAAADSRLVCERVGFVGCTSKIDGEGGAIYALGAAEVRLTASNFTNCAAKKGAAVYVKGGDATLTDCSFESSSVVYITERTAEGELKTKRGEGVVIVEGDNTGQLTIDACRFERNLGSSIVRIRSQRSAVIRNSVFFENNLERFDGAFIPKNFFENRNEILSVAYTQHVTFVDTRFELNRGEAIVAFQLFVGSFTIEGCDFINNTMFEHQDGLVLIKQVPMTNITVSRSTFKNNSGSKALGGALSLHVVDAWIDDCIFEQNAAREGGAIYIEAAAALRITGSTFSENIADFGGAIAACAGKNRDHRGGDIHPCTGLYELTNIVGVRNHARDQKDKKWIYMGGGGFMKVSGSDLVLRDVDLRGNTAAGISSSINLRYTKAELHNVEIDEPSGLRLYEAGRIAIYCSPKLVEEHLNLLADGGRTAKWDVFVDQSECSHCFSGSEWTGAPTNVRAGNLRDGGFLGEPFCNCIDCATGDFKPAGGRKGQMCESCPDGQFSPAPGWATCLTCPENTYRQGVEELRCQPCVPFSASPEGASGCYRCLDGYYRVPFQVTTEKGVESNVPCENFTHLDPEFFAACCRSCDAIDGTRDCTNGTTLADLPVKRNYWRATELDEEIYRCFYKQSCVGSRDGENSWGNGLCRDGHKGPLCNVCEKDHYFSTAELGCRKCGEISSPGVFAVVLLAAASLLALAAVAIFYPSVLSAVAHSMVMGAARTENDAEELVADLHAAVDDEALGMERADMDASQREEEEERSNARSTYMFTKVKIVISCYQIVGGILRIFPTIRWPLSYEKFAQTFGFASLDLSSLAHPVCILPWADYIDRLEFSTIWPLGVIALMCVAYNVLKRIVPADSAIADRNKWIYMGMLLGYFVFPTNSTFVFRYFSCIKLDQEGRDPSTMKVLMADMSISCRSDRYKQTSIFVWIMVAIYPIGVPLAALYVLFVHRRQINPKVKIDAANAAGTDNKRGRLFKVCSMRQMERDIDERNKKKELKAFSFLFEEYEPRCWWYAVAELIFRLYLTGLISFFGSSHSPATTTQTSLGLFGAIIYYVVLSAFDPYIDPRDDTLAKVACFQIILTFYFATMLQARANSKDDDAGDPHNVWSGALFGAACCVVGASTLVLAVVMIFIGSKEFRKAAEKAMVKIGSLVKSGSLESVAEEDADGPTTDVPNHAPQTDAPNRVSDTTETCND